MKTAVYPGSFDPVTFGHLDIITRAAAMFDEVIVLVMDNSAKHSLFSTDERVKILQKAANGLKNVKIDVFHGLMIEYCKAQNIHIVIRGLRAITDFEYELQIAQTNKEMSNGFVDTVFLTTDIKYSYLSSSTVKEFARYHANVSHLVPAFVGELLEEKFKNE